jgi:hypothetical protein
MPVRRESRNVVANPEELNQWLQRTSGEAVGVHVVTPGSDLLKDLRASLAVQKSSRNSRSQPKNEPRSSRGTKAPKTKASANPNWTHQGAASALMSAIKPSPKKL